MLILMILIIREAKEVQSFSLQLRKARVRLSKCFEGEFPSTIRSIIKVVVVDVIVDTGKIPRLVPRAHFSSCFLLFRPLLSLFLLLELFLFVGAGGATQRYHLSPLGVLPVQPFHFADFVENVVSENDIRVAQFKTNCLFELLEEEREFRVSAVTSE